MAVMLLMPDNMRSSLSISELVLNIILNFLNFINKDNTRASISREKWKKQFWDLRFHLGCRKYYDVANFYWGLTRAFQFTTNPETKRSAV